MEATVDNDRKESTESYINCVTKIFDTLDARWILLTIDDSGTRDLDETMQPSLGIRCSIFHVLSRIFTISTAVCLHLLESLPHYALIFIIEKICRHIRFWNSEVAYYGEHYSDETFNDIKPRRMKSVNDHLAPRNWYLAPSPTCIACSAVHIQDCKGN
jgi:hypothetical protein